MVALEDPYALHLPNLRALYLPDPGSTLIEADLRAADAFVIAWEAGAAKMKERLHADADLHSPNAQLLYGSRLSGDHFSPVRAISPRDMHSNGMSYRDNAKRWVHATNFGGRAGTVASTIACPEKHVEAVQKWWLRVEHPEIGALHDRVEFDLRSRRNPIIHNRFGFRRLYVGGNRSGNLLGQALAWIAQSTVAVAINRAMLAVDCAADLLGRDRCGTCMCCEGWPVQLLMQHHDSLLMQVTGEFPSITFVERLRAAMAVTIPYEDEPVIPCEIKWSAESWGAMKPWQDEVALRA